MRVADICTRDVIHIDAGMSVRDAAQLMREKHIGTLVVVEQPNSEQVPVGIVTDRDIVLSVIAAGVDARMLSVGDVMSRELATCTESQELLDAVQIMRSRGVRRLPVLNGHGGLYGLVSADDIISVLGTHLREISHAMSLGQVHEMENRP